MKKERVTVDNVAAPLQGRKRKESPTIHDMHDWVPSKSPRLDEFFRRVKQKFADEENYRAGETSASIPPPSDGQTILSPSADVAAKNPKPIHVHSESETELTWFDSPPVSSEASTPVEDETSSAGFRCLAHRLFPEVPEESILKEPEASIPSEPEASNSKDNDVESTCVVSDDTGVAVPVAMEAEAEVPNLSLIHI